MNNANKIQAWRNEHPGERITSTLLRGIIGTADLWGADLWGADLWGADLRDADLRGANLRDADLRGANLGDANLRDAVWFGLRVDGLPSGQVTLTPTPVGWDLRVGCWRGTPDTLRTLIATDTGWPEAQGNEITRRRPLLVAALTLIDAHTTDRAQVIADLAKKWGTA